MTTSSLSFELLGGIALIYMVLTLPNGFVKVVAFQPKISVVSSRCTSMLHAKRNRFSLLNFAPDGSDDVRSMENNPNGIGHSTRDYIANTAFYQSQYIPVEPESDAVTVLIAPRELEADCDVYQQAEYKWSNHELDREAVINISAPIIAPFIAFVTYDAVAEIFAAFVDLLSDNNWVAVDGGAYQAKIMVPLINAVVVPAIAVLFATLTSTTISTLRQRQVDIRQALNHEASELRALETLLEEYPSSPATHLQERCRQYLIQYTLRLMAECDPSIGPGDNIINPSRSMDSELNGLLGVLNKHYKEFPMHIADQSYGCVSKLRHHRKERITALQSTYPILHYMILGVAALAECAGFLMEANQDVLVFLNAVQLKILWSMLIGTFVACFTVFYDMRAPFSGSYQITASVGQLHTIKLTLESAIEQRKWESKNTNGLQKSTHVATPTSKQGVNGLS